MGEVGELCEFGWDTRQLIAGEVQRGVVDFHRPLDRSDSILIAIDARLQTVSRHQSHQPLASGTCAGHTIQPA